MGLEAPGARAGVDASVGPPLKAAVLHVKHRRDRTRGCNPRR